MEQEGSSAKPTEQNAPKILDVTPMENYRLRLSLDVGNVLELDMKNRLQTVWFYSLWDRELFRSVATDGENLTFGGALQYSFEDLLLLVLAPASDGEEAEPYV